MEFIWVIIAILYFAVTAIARANREQQEKARQRPPEPVTEAVHEAQFPAQQPKVTARMRDQMRPERPPTPSPAPSIGAIAPPMETIAVAVVAGGGSVWVTPSDARGWAMGVVTSEVLQAPRAFRPYRRPLRRR